MADFTIDQVLLALKNAEASGNKGDAQRLAQIADNLRKSSAPPAPINPAPQAPERGPRPGASDMAAPGLPLVDETARDIASLMTPQPKPAAGPARGTPMQPPAPSVPGMAAPQTQPKPAPQTQPGADIASLMTALTPNPMARQAVDYPFNPSSPEMRSGIMSGRKPAQAAEPFDPFADESLSDLMTRRGQEFTQGASGVLQSVARARGINDNTLADAIQRDAPQRVQEAARQVESFEGILSRGVSDDGQSPMTEQERATYKQRLADASKAVEQWADAAEFGPAFAGNREAGAKAAAEGMRKWTDDTFGVPPQDDSLWSDLSYGAGSMAGFVAPTLLAGPAGTMVTAQMGADVAKVEAYDRAIAHGASERDAQSAAAIAGFLGTAEAVPIARALEKLPEPVRRDVIGRVGRFLSQSVKGGIEEAAQEAGLAITQNLIAKGIYNPEQQIITPDVGEQALVGGILGAFMGGGANAAGLNRPRGAAARRDEPDAQTMAPRQPNNGVAPMDAPSPLARTPNTDGPQTNRLQPEQPTPTLPGEAPNPIFSNRGKINQQPQPAQDPIRGTPEEAEDVPAAAPPPLPAMAAIQPGEMTEGRNVEVSIAGGPLVIGRIGRMTREGPELIEPDGDVTILPIEDIDDGETRVFPEGAGATIAKPVENTVPFTGRGAVEGGARAVEGSGARPVPQEVAPDPAPEQRPAAARKPGEPERRFLTHDETLAIETDAKTFQYKDGGDAEGVTDRLRGVTEFDPNRAGQMILYQREDGRTVVADGHQRAGLARRAAEAGQQDVGGAAATIYRESDGISPEEVMVVAAVKNIAEGSGTAVDAARILRAKGATAADLGLPPRSALVRDADGIAKLSDDAFGMVANGVASERDAAAVGRVVDDQAAHANILSLLGKLKPATQAQAEMIARDAAADTAESGQDDLFGGNDATESLYLERAKILDAAVKDIRADRTVFSRLLKDGSKIEGAGNKLDQDENAKREREGAIVLEHLQRQANTKGPISDALTKAARDLKAGGGIAAARRAFVEDVKRALQGDGAEGGAAGVGGPAVAGPQAPEGQGDQETVAPQTERTPEGEQALIPGVAPVTDQDRAGAAQNKPLTGTDQGPGSGRDDLFGNPEDRRDLFDAAPEASPDPVALERAMRARLAPFSDKGDRLAGNTRDMGDQAGDILVALDKAKTPEARFRIADDYVLEQGRKHGVEYLVLQDADGLPMAVMVGDKGNVNPPPSFYRAAAEGVKVRLTHNHPSNRGFSPADITIMTWGDVDVVAMGHDGAVSRAVRGSAFKPVIRSMGEGDRIYAKVRNAMDAAFNALQRAMQEKIYSGEIEIGAAERTHAHIFNLILHRHGVIDFEGNSPQIIEKDGIDVDSLYRITDTAVRGLLGRAGFAVSEVRGSTRGPADQGRGGKKRAASDGQAVSGADGAPTADHDGDGRVQAVDVGRPLDTAGSAPQRGRVSSDGATSALRKAEGLEQPGDQFRDTFPAAFLTEMTSVDEAFAHPRATSRDMAGVFSEIAPEAQYIGDMGQQDITADSADVEKHLFRMPNGADFFVFQTEGEVWFDVSNLKEGQAGNALYAAMGDYAHNSGRAFIGDPDGLSDTALRRRTDAMLSSALKHGSAEHLQPHDYQRTGNPSIGVPPLEWRDGDNLGNIQSLIDVSVESLLHDAPQIADLRYDFRSATFRDTEGAPVTDEDFRAWASESDGVRAARAGVRTLKRGVLLNTLARSEGESRPGLLEQVLRQPGQLVGSSLSGIFYHRPAPGRTVADPAVIARAMPRLRAELDRLNLKRVTLELDAPGMGRQGAMVARAPGQIDILIGQSIDPDATLYHEAIHAMRAMNLFTPEEWTALETAAAKRGPGGAPSWIDKHRIPERYPDLMQDERIEEAIAEEFAERFASRQSPAGSVLVRAFNKIARLLKALRTAITGPGVQTSEDVFGKAMAGQIGARDAGNTGRAAMSQEQALSGWAREVFNLLRGMTPDGATLRLGPVPEVLQAFGGRGADLVMAGSKLRKVLAKHSDIDAQDIVNLPDYLSNPAMILRNPGDSRTGDILMVTDGMTATGDVLVAVVKRSGTDSRGQKATVVITAYGKAQIKDAVSAAQSAGDLLYVRGEREGSGYRHTGANSLNASLSDTFQHLRADPKIRTPRTTFKGGKPPGAVKGQALPSLEQPSFAPPEQAPDGKSRDGMGFSNSIIAKHAELSARYGHSGPPRQEAFPPVWGAPKRTGLRKMHEFFADRFIMFRAMEWAIEKQTGQSIPESMSFSLKETVFKGRVADRLERLMAEEIRPIQDAIGRSKVSLDDLGMYLIARHAPERNALMAKRDPKLFGKGGGSGMTDAMAAEVMDGILKKHSKATMDRLAKMIETVLRRDLKLRRAAGLISEEQYKAYTTMFEHYVPLRGFAEREEGGQLGTGRGFDIRGKESRSALGRFTLADNPVVQAFAMRQSGIVRAEKNRVMRALMRLVQKYPHPSVWEFMGKLPMRRMLDPETGMVKEIVDFGATREDDVVAVKIDGDTKYLRVKDPLMQAAVKNLENVDIGVVMKIIMLFRRGTTAFSRLQTAANPDFVVPNGVSDFIEGVWTAANAKEKEKIALDYAFSYKVALWQGVKAEFGDSMIGRKLTGDSRKRLQNLLGEGVDVDAAMSENDAYRREWEASGGKISFMAFRDLDEIQRNLEREIQRNGRRLWQIKPWEAVEDTLQVIEKINAPVESAGRLAMYIAARKNGLSKERSAELALDSSGNYYRQGRATKSFAALYAFFNPGVQGIEKFMRFSKRPRNWAIMGGLATFGFAWTLTNIAAYRDDDDPENRSLYLEIPEYARARSIIIPGEVEVIDTGVKDENGDPIMTKRLSYREIRIPHNLRPILIMGNKLAEIQSGQTDPDTAAQQVGEGFLMNTNPMGDATPGNFLTPTIFDPFVDVGLNRNFFDSPIRPESYPNEEGLPASYKYFERSTNPAFPAISQALNAASGGDKYNPGWADSYPDDIEYFWDFVTGGLGRFISRGIETGRNMAAGVESDPNRIPVLRSFSGRTTEYAEGRLYYAMREDIKHKKNRLAAARKDMEEDPTDALARETFESLMVELNAAIHPKSGNFDWQQSTWKIIDKADDFLSGARQDILAAMRDDTLGHAERQKRIRALRVQIEGAQIKAREDVLRLLREVGTASGLP